MRGALSGFGMGLFVTLLGGNQFSFVSASLLLAAAAFVILWECPIFIPARNVLTATRGLFGAYGESPVSRRAAAFHVSFLGSATRRTLVMFAARVALGVPFSGMEILTEARTAFCSLGWMVGLFAGSH